MSVDKYKSTRLALAFRCQNGSVKKRSTLNSVKMNATVEYGKLMKFITSIDMGDLHDFRMNFCKEFDDDPIKGAYKELGYLLPIMAEMYLFLSEERLININWFNDQGLFQVSLGADGAPFGKDDEATAWLVSFANMGKRVASAHDNFLLCGANASEGSKPMIRYTKKLVHHMVYVEKKVFNVLGKDIRF